MNVVDKIRSLAKANPHSIVLPEGLDPRIVAAASILAAEGLAKPVLVGPAAEVRALAQKEGVSLDGVEVADPATDARTAEYAAKFHELRSHKGVDEAKAAALMQDPIHFGTMMLYFDHVDGFLAGAAHATADTIRPSLQVIKPAPGTRAISSFFIMNVPNSDLGENGVFIFGDCAINPDPSPVKLAAIAISSARTGSRLCGFKPKVAMLSFSTKGSAEHELVDRVRKATEIVKEKAPDLEVDGELQADAAIVAKVAKLKAPDSPVAGQANVLIFPDLQSANIGYKLVQRLAKAEATGPILTGFRKPVNDLSRGCSVEDAVNLACVTGIQAQEAKEAAAA